MEGNPGEAGDNLCDSQGLTTEFKAPVVAWGKFCFPRPWAGPV